MIIENQDNSAIEKVRFHYWDTWKGICIIGVIAIHASSSTSFFPENSFNWHFGFFLRQLINFPLAIFLFISGYFAANYSFNSWREYISFWSTRLLKIIPPYIFWSLIYIWLEKPSHLINSTEISQDLLLGTGIEFGYFIIVLIQFVLLTPIIINIRNDRSNLAWMIIISAIGITVTYLLNLKYFNSEFSQFPFYVLPFYAWYPFYHLGVWVNKKGFIERNLPLDLTIKFLLFYLLFLLLSFLEAVILSQHGLYSFAISEIKVSSFFCSLFLCLSIVALYAKYTDPGLISWIGKYYYSIYLMHMLFLDFSENIIKQNYLGLYNSQPLTIFLEIILVIIACSAIIALINKFLPKNLSAIIIGKR